MESWKLKWSVVHLLDTHQEKLPGLEKAAANFGSPRNEVIGETG